MNECYCLCSDEHTLIKFPSKDETHIITTDISLSGLGVVAEEGLDGDRGNGGSKKTFGNLSSLEGLEVLETHDISSVVDDSTDVLNVTGDKVIIVDRVVLQDLVDVALSVLIDILVHSVGENVLGDLLASHCCILTYQIIIIVS